MYALRLNVSSCVQLRLEVTGAETLCGPPEISPEEVRASAQKRLLAAELAVAHLTVNG